VDDTKEEDFEIHQLYLMRYITLRRAKLKMRSIMLFLLSANRAFEEEEKKAKDEESVAAELSAMAESYLRTSQMDTEVVMGNGAGAGTKGNDAGAGDDEKNANKGGNDESGKDLGGGANNELAHFDKSTGETIVDGFAQLSHRLFGTSAPSGGGTHRREDDPTLHA